MDELITRAIQSINKILESPSKGFDNHERSGLIDVRNLLHRLLEPKILQNEWTSLFCRQLNRLIDYNESLTGDFWNELHDDILYVLEEPNDAQYKADTQKRFLRRMNFEKKLEQRELDSDRTVRENKSLSQLLCEHQNVLEEYLRKCISLHSNIEVNNLIENIDDLLQSNYGLTEISLTSENRKRLKEKLKCINITIDCSNRSLKSLYFPLSTYDYTFNKSVESLTSYLPSLEPIDTNKFVRIIKMDDLLQSDRWIVVLGDLGSAKTTLLRWITRVLAEKVNPKRNHDLSVRIPILIRIGEFSTWLDQHKSETLMDYIGEHTWFAERYCYDIKGEILKEFVYHGHALILLDGLDEIPEVGERNKIVDMIRKFIDEYIRAPDFISPFDDRIFECMWNEHHFTETQSPNRTGGNQIVVTSRMIGYQFHPLKGPFIKHYSLLLLDHKEVETFVKDWMLQVDERFFHALRNEGIELDNEIVKDVLTKRTSTMKGMFENSSQLLMSNFSPFP